MTANSNTAQPARATGRFQPGERRVGRKPGVPNKATAEIKAIAQQYGAEAIEKLVTLMRGKDEDVAFKACIALLDRAYGKPAQAIVGDPEQPVEHNVTLVDEFTRRIAAMADRVAASALSGCGTQMALSDALENLAGARIVLEAFFFGAKFAGVRL